MIINHDCTLGFRRVFTYCILLVTVLFKLRPLGPEQIDPRLDVVFAFMTIAARPCV